MALTQSSAQRQAQAELPTSSYAGHSRFTLELEFVQLLANPLYLHHLATTPGSSYPASEFVFATSARSERSAGGITTSLLLDDRFVAYLKYLLYWTSPPYLNYLKYPDATCHVLKLLQEEKFRKDVCGNRGWSVCESLGEVMKKALNGGMPEAPTAEGEIDAAEEGKEGA